MHFSTLNITTLIKNHIPNFITVLNLLSGCLSVVFTFQGNLMLASWFIGLAAIFDFMDGMAARLLHAKSAIGVQLDSLADLISFGMAPGVIVYQLMTNSYNIPIVYFMDLNPLALFAFLIPVFSALRLAKFNIDERQTEAFLGLPTPADALFFASLPLVLDQAHNTNSEIVVQVVHSFWFLMPATLIFSGLMVSEIPLISLKFKNFIFKDNIARYLLISIACILLLLLGYLALPLIVVAYFVISIFFKR